MKTKEIRELSDAELVSKIADLQLEKTARVRQIRRDIARIYTEQTARAAKVQ